jgi:hypothetical protein
MDNTNKCVICGFDIPVIYAQIILDCESRKVACLSHEGSKELYDYIEDENEKLRQQNQKLKFLIEDIQLNVDCICYDEPGSCIACKIDCFFEEVKGDG